jgi:hypothetical protein
MSLFLLCSGRACPPREWQGWGLRVLLALIICLSVSAADGAARRKGPPQDLPGHIAYLAHGLVGLNIDESPAITSQIQKLLLNHLQATLANVTPTAVGVRREIEAAFAKVAYPVQTDAEVFSRPWNDALVTCSGFTISWLPYPKVNTLAIFVTRDGKTRMVTTDNFLPFYDLSYEFLPGQENAPSFRFIVYGARPGKSQPRLAAVLYAFDGKTLTRQWEKEDIYDGKLDVTNGEVVITYLNENEYIHAFTRDRKPPRYEATYKLTPTTLEVDHIKNIPF